MRHTRTFVQLLTVSLVAVAFAASTGHESIAQRATKSTNPGKARKQIAPVVHRPDEAELGRGRKAPRRADEPAVIDVFKDFNAWWDDNRDGATLTALGKVQGFDHFVHPVAELADGISPATDVLLLTSNSWGQASTRLAQNHPTAQSNLAAFVRRGGVAIVDMGDNDHGGGFMAPGAVGTPHLIFPTDGANATLTADAAGDDGLFGTDDDHRMVRGADGIAGTSDDLNDSKIDACCYVAHGNLEDGIALPPSTTVLMTADFGGVQKPILAEYCVGYGRVIVDTVTKEFEAHEPFGQGPSRFMLSLLAYAMNVREQTDCRVNGLIESVLTMQPDKVGALLVSRLTAIRSDLANGKHRAARGKLQAFVNELRSRNGRTVREPLAREWMAIASQISQALAADR
jgi:hypothetical protein